MTLTVKRAAICLAACAVAAMGCSEAPNATGPASAQDQLSEQETLPFQLPSVKHDIVGIWSNENGTVTIKPRGPNLYRVITETPLRKIDGQGHLRGNELITIRWYVDASLPENVDRHVYATYVVDGDVLYAQSYESDGTPAYPNVFTRVQ